MNPSEARAWQIRRRRALRRLLLVLALTALFLWLDLAGVILPACLRGGCP